MPRPYDMFFAVSHVPQIFSRNPTKMNFLKRVKNVFSFFSGKIAFRFVFLPKFIALKTKYNIRPERSLLESMDDKELTLFLADFAFEYPQPLRPGNMKVCVNMMMILHFLLPHLLV